MFSTCVDALAPKGRLIIIGMMSQYASGWAPSSYPGLTGERKKPGGCVVCVMHCGCSIWAIRWNLAGFGWLGLAGWVRLGLGALAEALCRCAAACT
jgi:hypothetical protein